MGERLVDYPNWYPKLNDIQVRTILKHCDKHGIESNICAYYEDWDDFCSDWVDHVGYTTQEAKSKLQDGKRTGEFLEFDGWGILRFAM